MPRISGLSMLEALMALGPLSAMAATALHVLLEGVHSARNAAYLAQPCSSPRSSSCALTSSHQISERRRWLAGRGRHRAKAVRCRHLRHAPGGIASPWRPCARSLPARCPGPRPVSRPAPSVSKLLSAGSRHGVRTRLPRQRWRRRLEPAFWRGHPDRVPGGPCRGRGGGPRCSAALCHSDTDGDDGRDSRALGR